MSQSEKQDRVVYHRPTTRTVFCVIALLCTLGDLYALRPPTSLDITCCILQITGIIAAARFPKCSSILLIALDFCIAAFHGTVSTAYGMFLAIGLLSYETTNTLSAAALAVVAVSQAVQQWLFLGGNFFRPPYVAVIITYALAAFGGSAARINNEAFRAHIEAERSRMALRRVREYAKLSDEIHDHTTGELSLIVRIAQQRIEQGSSEANTDPENLKAWGQVEESARTTLHDIRRVINELDDVSDGALALMTDEELQSNEDFERRLHELAAEQDRKLALAGFRGHGIVAMAKVIFEDPHAQALILDTTTEMYGNIARHAVKDEEYTVSVTINQDGALIVTSNATKPDDGMTGGHGLLALERNLRKHGGSLETELSDGRRYWYADIRI